ncbi:hypothetical protein U9M48_038734 [Paspalum notatum var. saurae]|uniref:Uncharacterized protein n=1 Tax=Paspalum notatum var. saurae TaxID=547442 RepID=A0AAQ3UHE4_PASNO
MDAPLGVAAVLSEALCLARRSKRHMLPCLLLALIPSSLLLAAGSHVSVYSLLLGFIARLHSLDRENPATPRFFGLLIRLKSDAAALSHANATLAAASHLGHFASTVIIAHAAAAACAGRHLPAKDLLQKLAESWRTGPLETYLYSTLLSAGYTALSVSLIAVPALNTAAGPSPRLAVVAAAAAAAAARFLYIYLAMVWAVGVVVSILEDGCRGLEAMHRAGEAVRGRRAQGFLIAVVLAIANASAGLGRGGPGWRDVLARAAHLLVGVFSPMVYTVFYHECRKNHGGDGAPPELPRRSKVDHDRQGAGVVAAV